MTAELTTWLRQQIDADEASAADRPPNSWVPDGLSAANPLAALYAPARTIAVRREMVAGAGHDAWALRALAATAYADRPGYRPEWAPDADE